MVLIIVLVFLSTLFSAVGYEIPKCSANGKLDAMETTVSILTCTGITEDLVLWDFTPDNGVTSQIALCSWPSLACQTADDDYTVFRRQYNTSVLAISQNRRTKMAGTVRCGAAFNGTMTYFASCRVRVVYPTRQVTNCHTEVDRTDWTVSGSCDVDMIWASDGQYSCQWYHLPMPVGYQTIFDGVMTLTTFTDNGLEYQRGRCSFSGQPVPTADGVQSYSLRIDPGDNFHGSNVFFGQSIEIQRLGDPALINCPPVVVEGDDVNCSCHSGSGSPFAVVTWLTDGAIDSVLRLTNVSRSLDGHGYTCTQHWGGFNINTRTTTYTLHVAYPPSSPPLITGLTPGDSYSLGDNATVSCTVTGGRPPVSSVSFHCDAHADGADTVSTVNGETAVTSTVTFNSLTIRDNGTRCLCYATWREKPDLYVVTATATLLITNTPKGVDHNSDGNDDDDDDDDDDNGDARRAATGSSNDDSTRLATIVGATTGGVAVVFIIALIIVIVILLKRRSGGKCDANVFSELDTYTRGDRAAGRVTSYDNPAMQRDSAKEVAIAELHRL